MNRKLATSDLHLGHTNIVKFTKRIEAMDRDGFVIPNEYRKPYFDGTLNEELKRKLTDIHDAWLIYTLDNQINNGDTVYHLGDLYFPKDKEKLREFILRLKGNWVFLLGNHDNESMIREVCKGTRHKVVGHYHEISVNKIKVCLFHFPIEEWHKCHRGAWHLHGHLHGAKGHGNFELKSMERRMDVGLDAHPTHGIFDLEELIHA